MCWALRNRVMMMLMIGRGGLSGVLSLEGWIADGLLWVFVA